MKSFLIRLNIAIAGVAVILWACAHALPVPLSIIAGFTLSLLWVIAVFGVEV